MPSNTVRARSVPQQLAPYSYNIHKMTGYRYLVRELYAMICCFYLNSINRSLNVYSCNSFSGFVKVISSSCLVVQALLIKDRENNNRYDTPGICVPQYPIVF
ncbi:hypothetical protein ABW19_dt0201938 [Dactylella cylindrospora]|nr:hypothetical protein ABW19_dt0201938 [Dactylella cylindrospora]